MHLSTDAYGLRRNKAELLQELPELLDRLLPAEFSQKSLDVHVEQSIVKIVNKNAAGSGQ